MIHIQGLPLNLFRLSPRIRSTLRSAFVAELKTHLCHIAMELTHKYSFDSINMTINHKCLPHVIFVVYRACFHQQQLFMKKITIILLLLCLLSIITHSQAGNPFNENANFEGDFDSMNHIKPTKEQKPTFTKIDTEEEYSNVDEAQEEQDMLEFAEHMADFLPDQTFTFKMEPNQQEQFFLWPGPGVLFVRGMFHSEVLDDDLDGQVNLALYDNDRLIRNYRQQRLGIFNIPHVEKDHRYTFNFQNSDSQTQVYFSYQFATKQKKDSMANTGNESEIVRITRQFERVNRLIVQQESEMNRLVSISDHHQQKIDAYLSSVEWTMVLETLMISLGNMASLMMLKRQLYAGYELLV